MSAVRGPRGYGDGQYGFPVRARRRIAPGNSPWPRTPNRLLYAWALGNWAEHEAHRLALAVVWGRYDEASACWELAVHLAWHAEQAGIVPGKVAPADLPSCRDIAQALLDAELARLRADLRSVLEQMTQAVAREERGDAQLAVATKLAREARVPVGLIAQALRWGRWRQRQARRDARQGRSP